MSDKRFVAMGLEDAKLYQTVLGYFMIENQLNHYRDCTKSNTQQELCGLTQLDISDGRAQKIKETIEYQQMMSAYDAIDYYRQQYYKLDPIDPKYRFDHKKIKIVDENLNWDLLSVELVGNITNHIQYVGEKDSEYFSGENSVFFQMLKGWGMDNVVIPRNKALASNMVKKMNERKLNQSAIIVGAAHTDANFGAGLQTTESPANHTLQAYLFKQHVSYIVISS